MPASLTLEQIEEKKKLIKQGLYWEALDLPQESTTGQIVLRIASLRQSANNDADFRRLLNIVRRDCQSGNYPTVRRQVWDELFPKLNEVVAAPVLNLDDEDISPETIWNCISDKLSSPKSEVTLRVRSALTDKFRTIAVNLGNNAQKQAPQDHPTRENVTKAIKAVKKCIFCLKLAGNYTDNPQYIKQQLSVATDIERDYEKVAGIRDYPIPAWPERPTVAPTPRHVPEPAPKPKPKPKPKPVPEPKPATPPAARKTAKKLPERKPKPKPATPTAARKTAKKLPERKPKLKPAPTPRTRIPAFPKLKPVAISLAVITFIVVLSALIGTRANPPEENSSGTVATSVNAPVILTPQSVATSSPHPTINSKYVSAKAPLIDGVLSTSEWPEPAFSKTFTYSFQNEEKTGVMKGYFMNDDNSLYVATTVTAKDFRPDILEKEKALLALDIFFDENNDGILRKGEDNKKFWQFQYEDWHQRQENKPYGTTWEEQQDGKGACIYSDTADTYVYECQIPLNSGDNEDLAVEPGDVMGIRLVLSEYIETEASNRWENIGFDSWPTGQGWIDGPYGQLVLVTSSTPSPTPTPTFWVPDDYSTIQAAVNAASPGDTIIVRDGTYNENVNVDKRLTLRSENGAVNCIVSASKSSDPVFNVTADYVNITGFTVRDAYYRGYGIYLYEAEHCIVSDNKATNNDYGVYLYDSSNNNIAINTASNNDWSGIYLDSSSNNNITGNTASKSFDGSIYLNSSSNNTLTGNTASDNYGYGIYLDSSSNNILTGNAASGNGYDGIYLYSSSNNNILTGNTISNNFVNGIDLEKSSNNTITNNNASGNDFGSIWLWSSNNNTITSNTATSNAAWSTDYGISLSNSSSNILTGNNASNNEYGIYLRDSDNNTLNGNNAANNDYQGIYLSDSRSNTLTSNNASNNYHGIWLVFSSSSNTIYLNSFIGNAYNVVSSNSTNTWNSTKQITYTYKGTNYTNYLGNYWSDYAGSDPDKDGIGNSPYSISGDNPDRYPLMKPFENYKREPSPLPPAPTPTPSPTTTPTFWVPDNYTTIQAAVNAASPGNTIIVRDGTYNENVDVSKGLTIRSENGAANCIVSASKSNDHVFYVTADYVNITGFTVQNATGDYDCGIYLYHADHCAISDNNLTNNDFGIYLSSSSNNTITSNIASNNNDYGIRLSSSSNNTINDNTAFDNGNYGIYLRSSNNSNLTSNDASNNGVDGIRLSSSSNNNLTDNTASNNNNYGISLCDSGNNTLSSNTASNNDDDGIRLISSDKNTLTSNTASGNGGSGIYLENSRKNTLTHNTASNNHVYDIYLDWTSSSNTIDGKTASND